MFRASRAHLQEDTVVNMQHMVLSLSMRVLGGLSVHSLSCVPTSMPPAGFESHNPSKRAAVDPRLRLRKHCDR